MVQVSANPSPNASGGAASPCPLPPCFQELMTFDGGSVDRQLGYFGNERFVIFSFHPTAAEVIWKDGRSSGFGGGGWRMFLDLWVPLAERSGARLGTLNAVGVDVLLIDRETRKAYVASRSGAEAFIARVHGKPPPTRRCLCGMMPPGLANVCDDCPFKQT